MTRSTNKDTTNKLPSRLGTFEPRSFVNGIPTNPFLTEIVRTTAAARPQKITFRLRFHHFISNSAHKNRARELRRSELSRRRFCASFYFQWLLQSCLLNTAVIIRDRTVQLSRSIQRSLIRTATTSRAFPRSRCGGRSDKRGASN